MDGRLRPGRKKLQVNNNSSQPYGRTELLIIKANRSGR